MGRIGCRGGGCLVAVVAALSVWLAGGSGALAAGWAVQPVPAPELAEGSLSGVSCRSAAWCIAVGSSSNVGFAQVSSVRNGAVMELWNGKGWSFRHIRGSSYGGSVACTSRSFCMALGLGRWNGRRWSQKPDAVNGEASSVACGSARACVAVGTDVQSLGSDGEVSLTAVAERWNGRSWKAARVTRPGWVNSSLASVSCGAAGSCVAVGSAQHASGKKRPLVERWNGARWSIVGAPAQIVLSGVSCWSSNACMAVGTRAGRPIAARWNGARWLSKPMATPGRVGSLGLSDLSCADSGKACAAVGGFTDHHRQWLLMEHWNGRRWSAQRLPMSGSAGSGGLDEVSCAAHAFCMAVGSQEGSDGQSVTIATRWRRTRWSPSPTVNDVIVDQDVTFNGVSCVSPSSCTAVGSDLRQMVVAQWNGAAWRAEVFPTPLNPSAALNGVSCTSASSCVAVGSISTQTVVLRWDGSTWNIQPSPADVGQLVGVSCVSPESCVAVGYNNNGSHFVPILERWDGTQWSNQQSAAPAGALGSSLSSVSCTSATACVAVGGYEPANSSLTSVLAERWDGTSWTVQNVAASGSSNAPLTGVSCASATACVAVGGDGDALTSLVVERWDGTSWTQQATPAPPDGVLTGFAAVSCPSTTDCLATGNDFVGNGVAGLWDGTSWTIQNVVPSNAETPQSANLNSVSCTSVTTCTAVGRRSNAGGVEALVERYS